MPNSLPSPPISNSSQTSPLVPPVPVPARVPGHAGDSGSRGAPGSPGSPGPLGPAGASAGGAYGERPGGRACYVPTAEQQAILGVLAMARDARRRRADQGRAEAVSLVSNSLGIGRDAAPAPGRASLPPRPSEPRPRVTIKELARLARLSERTIRYRMTNMQQGVHYFRVGKSLRFDSASALEFLSDAPAATLESPTDEPPSDMAALLADFRSRGRR